MAMANIQCSITATQHLKLCKRTLSSRRSLYFLLRSGSGFLRLSSSSSNKVIGLCVLCCMCYKNASAFQHFRPWKPEILALSPPLRGPSLPYLRRPGPNLMISGCTQINANLKNTSWSEQGQSESACDLLSLLLSSCDPVPLLCPQSQVLVPRFVCCCLKICPHVGAKAQHFFKGKCWDC